MPQGLTETTLDPLWYKDAIIYELHVRAFYDSNGDGIGDFQGLTQKLDYLQELGVNALWLMPFFPSQARTAPCQSFRAIQQKIRPRLHLSGL